MGYHKLNQMVASIKVVPSEVLLLEQISATPGIRYGNIDLIYAFFFPIYLLGKTIRINLLSTGGVSSIPPLTYLRAISNFMS